MLEHKLSRRHLLAIAPASLSSAPWRLAPAPDERVILTERDGPTRVILPARGCRLLAHWQGSGAWPLAACAAVAFAARTANGEDITMLAVVGLGRLLLIEPCAGVAADGAHLSTRLDVVPPGRGLILQRDAAVPHAGRTAWERQSWTDILVASRSGLDDAPARPPLADTWQANLASRRVRALARLSRATTAIDATLLGQIAIWPWTQGG